MYDLTIIIPTYKEEANIRKIIVAVTSTLKVHNLMGEILVVDDNSPDNTIPIVNDLMRRLPHLRLRIRREDKGLSQSVVEGFSSALSDNLIVIDADGSHPPGLIPQMFKRLQAGNDVVIGSRYMPGGGIKKWPLGRRIISLGATFLGRLLFPDITDPVSGFFGIKRAVVENAPLKPKGYKILLEVLGKGQWEIFSEIPYEFVDRAIGTSKLKFQTIVEYAQQVFDITTFALHEKRGKVWKEWEKIFKFGIVGLIGTVVNMGLLYYLKEYQDFPLLFASFIAIELAILNNFLWNEFWTFKNNSHSFLSHLVGFNLVSVGGLLINMAVLSLLTTLGVYYLLSNFFGILIGFSWNFLANRRYTWKKV